VIASRSSFTGNIRKPSLVWIGVTTGISFSTDSSVVFYSLSFAGEEGGFSLGFTA